MARTNGNLKERLARYGQITISMIGRKSGNTISIPTRCPSNAIRRQTETLRSCHGVIR